MNNLTFLGCVAAGAIGSSILFFLIDKKVLNIFQRTTEWLMKLVGRDCFWIATFVAVFGSASQIIFATTLVILIGGSNAVGTWIYVASILLAAVTFAAGMYYVSIGRKIYKQNSESYCLLDYNSSTQLYGHRFRIFVYGGTYSFLTFFIPDKLAKLGTAYTFITLVIILYFASCTPASKQGASVLERIILRIKEFVSTPNSEPEMNPVKVGK
jgi:hypothetical protein